MLKEKAKSTLNVIELRPLESAGDLVLATSDVDVENIQPSFLRRHLVLIVLVIIPSFLSILYFGFMESNQYSVEASYIVRTLNGGAGSATLSLIGGNQSYARSEEDTFAVNEYLHSRDAAEKMQPQLQKAFSRESIDFFHRFPNILNMLGSTSKEALYNIFENQITVTSASSGISTLEVRAFDAKDATDIANTLLMLGEQLVNSMNERAAHDSVRLAKIAVEEARANYEAQQLILLNYRNRELIIDPQKQGTAALEVVTKLVAQVAQDEAALAQMVALSPKNPQITTIRERIKAYRAQMAIEQAKIVGGKDAIVTKLGTFEQILLRRELAARSLSEAISSYEAAKHEAERQQFYLETIVRPVTPDRARYPYRIMLIAMSIGSALMFFWIFKKTALLISEHQA